MSFTGIGPMLFSMVIDRWMGARSARKDEPIRRGSSCGYAGHMELRSQGIGMVVACGGRRV